MNIDPDQPEYHLVQYLVTLRELLTAAYITKEDAVMSIVGAQRTLDKAIDLLLEGPQQPNIPDGWPPE
jgi:hypothetical protein